MSNVNARTAVHHRKPVCRLCAAGVAGALIQLTLPVATAARIQGDECPMSADWELHDSTALVAAMTANGLLGAWDLDPQQPATGLLVRECEFETLFMATLWVGARISGEVHVSTGHDGWYSDREIRPLRDEQELQRHAYPADLAFGTRLADRFDGCEGAYESHRPMRISVDMATIGPADPDAEFLLLAYRITNRSEQVLQDTYVGLYWDGDVGPTPETLNEAAANASDDVAGSRTIDDGRGGETLLAFIADGVQTGSYGDDTLVPVGIGVTRLSFVQDPYAWSSHCNWWISDPVPDRDWGPGLPFPDGVDGTPLGDANKYRVLGNWAAEPPDPDLLDLSDPSDARFLLSHRIADLAPGESEIVIWAVVAADVWIEGEFVTANLQAAVLEARDYAERLSVGESDTPVRGGFSIHAPVPLSESIEDDPM
ncbi:MAG: hypothetical protein CME06_17895 [Gemmatimonadetes bacterium]|nr:hypothetical protein [Gemmatimonadota bacterium]